MKKFLAITVLMLIVAGAAAGTTAMLRNRNEPPPPPPDPRPCLTQAQQQGMGHENLRNLAVVGREPLSAIDRINLREELRRSDVPACQWAITQLDQ